MHVHGSSEHVTTKLRRRATVLGVDVRNSTKTHRHRLETRRKQAYDDKSPTRMCQFAVTRGQGLCGSVGMGGSETSATQEKSRGRTSIFRNIRDRRRRQQNVLAAGGWHTTALDTAICRTPIAVKRYGYELSEQHTILPTV